MERGLVSTCCNLSWEIVLWRPLYRIAYGCFKTTVAMALHTADGSTTSMKESSRQRSKYSEQYERRESL